MADGDARQAVAVASPSRLRGALANAGSDSVAVARGGAVNFAGGVGGAVASLLLLVLLARRVGVTETGLFFQAIAVVSTGAILGNLGAQITLTQRIARRLAHGERDLDDLIWAAILPVACATVLAGLCVVLVHEPFAALLTSPGHEAELGQLLVAAAPALPLIALTRIVVGIPRGLGEMWPAVVYDSGGQPLLRLVLCGAVAVTDGPTWLLGAAFSAAAAICLLAAVPHTVRSLRRHDTTYSWRPRWPRETGVAFWRFAAPRGLEEVFAATNIWLLVVLVGALVSADEAATYAAVSRFTLAAALLMQAITTSMAPRFTAAFALGDRARVESLFRATTQWMVGLSIPACVTLFVYPQALIHLVSPDLPGGATGLRITAVATLFSVVTGPAGGAILFAGRSTWNLWIAIADFVVMLLVAALAIPGSGANGACLAWAAAMITQSVLGYAVARRAFGLDPFSARAARLGAWSAVLAILTQVAARVALGDGLAGLVVGVLAAAVALVAVNAATSWSWWRPAPDTATAGGTR
jgi:O-antigen/teichoic acid export membrane protein